MKKYLLLPTLFLTLGTVTAFADPAAKVDNDVHTKGKVVVNDSQKAEQAWLVSCNNSLALQEASRAKMNQALVQIDAIVHLDKIYARIKAAKLVRFDDIDEAKSDTEIARIAGARVLSAMDTILIKDKKELPFSQRLKAAAALQTLKQNMSTFLTSTDSKCGKFLNTEIKEKTAQRVLNFENTINGVLDETPTDDAVQVALQNWLKDEGLALATAQKSNDLRTTNAIRDELDALQTTPSAALGSYKVGDESASSFLSKKIDALKTSSTKTPLFDKFLENAFTATSDQK